MLTTNDFKKRNNNVPTLYAILPRLPLDEDLISPVTITAYRDIQFAIINSQVPSIEDARNIIQCKGCKIPILSRDHGHSRRVGTRP